MTKTQFYRLLKQLGKKWRVCRDGSIRCGRHCPITAVCREVTGTAYHIDSYFSAAREMDLAEEDAQDISLAADNPNYRERPRLLRALGLKETI